MQRSASFALLLTTPLLACAGPQSALDPQGPAAEQAALMTWILLGMGVAVSGLVLVVFGLVVWRQRGEESRRDEPRALRWVLLGGVALPTLVITPLFFYAVALYGRLVPSEAAALTVEIEGHQWWWTVRYRAPEQPGVRVASANEVHIPAGRRVRLVLTSTDVIHSFWVPSLQGKTDLIPGRRTSTWIEANRPGVYRGQCAEFCGLQHARMTIRVIAHEPGEFDAWLARERLPSAPLDTEGYRVFQERGCAACHTVRGTPAGGATGPDLTHFASRGTIAAGLLPNDDKNLTAWIANPQVVKPGNRMPPVPLSASELRAVVAYLESLR